MVFKLQEKISKKNIFFYRVVVKGYF